MTIHRNYTRLNAADRAVVDRAYTNVRETLNDFRRAASNTDPAERLVEAIATYLIESGGAARVGMGANLTAPIGTEHPSYGA